MNKKGFTLYLTFVITTLVFILATSSQSLSRLSLDIGRSSMLETLAFHTADGGLEKGLAMLRNSFNPINFSYEYILSANRKLKVEVSTLQSAINTSSIDLHSKVQLFEGDKLVLSKTYARNNITQELGRNGIGHFMEVK
jgi:hypothetical protein